MKKNMKCFGKWFEDDRICWLCEATNNDTYIKCKECVLEERELSNKLWNIRSNCPYCKDSYEDYQHYLSCKLKSGSDDGCHPKLECEKYCKKK